MSKIRIIRVIAILILTAGVIFSKSAEVIQHVSKRPGNFSKGVWIKKYPKNYACFKFETPDGFTIICDPFEMDETVSADIVTESHIDADHTNTSKITGFYNLFRNPGVYEENGIKVTGIGGWHDKAGPANETNTIFVFEINGIKIAHFASLGQAPSKEMWAKLDAFNCIDILLIQVFSDAHVYIKLMVGESCEIIDRLNPKIVIPEHGTPGISKSIAEHYHTQAKHINYNGFVVTQEMLKNINGHRIFDMDNGIIVMDDGTIITN